MADASVISESLASFTVVGASEDAESLPIRKAIPARRRPVSTVERTGRSRFAESVCELHPEYYHDSSDTPTIAIPDSFPCAKFSHLPGKGRGVSQPGIGKILVSTAFELLRPLMLIGMLLGGLYGFQHVVLHGSGFHLLRPASHVSQPTGGVPNSSEHATNSSVPTRSPSSPTRIERGNAGVPSHKVVVK